MHFAVSVHLILRWRHGQAAGDGGKLKKGSGRTSVSDIEDVDSALIAAEC